MKIREGSSGRVLPVDGQYLAHPSICCVCSRPPRDVAETFLNLGNVELDYYGVLYLCLDCAAEIADAIGSVTYETHARVQEIVREQNTTLAEDANQIAYLKGLLNARISASRSGKHLSDGDASVALLEVEPESVSVDSLLDGVELDVVKSGKG